MITASAMPEKAFLVNVSMLERIIEYSYQQPINLQIPL